MSDRDELAALIEANRTEIRQWVDHSEDPPEHGSSLLFRTGLEIADAILARWRLVPVEPCEHVAQAGVNGDTWACLDCGAHFAY